MRPASLVALLAIAVLTTGLLASGSGWPKVAEANELCLTARLFFTIDPLTNKGTLTLVCSIDGVSEVIGVWEARSGDNNPHNDCEKWDKTDNNPWGGAYPAWRVGCTADMGGEP